MNYYRDFLDVMENNEGFEREVTELIEMLNEMSVERLDSYRQTAKLLEGAVFQHRAKKDFAVKVERLSSIEAALREISDGKFPPISLDAFARMVAEHSLLVHEVDSARRCL